MLEAHPDLAGINRAIAFTYGKEGNHPEALKYLDLALAGNPNDTLLLQLAAASATTLNDFPRAMAYLARVDEASLDNPSVLADAAVNLINKRLFLSWLRQSPGVSERRRQSGSREVPDARAGRQPTGRQSARNPRRAQIAAIQYRLERRACHMRAATDLAWDGSALTR